MSSVLVVDHDAPVRDMVTGWVRSIGHTAKPAANAEEALQTMLVTQAAVALCDMRMPRHDGLWLAGQLRHHFPETAVILTTGLQEVGAAQQSLKSGVVDYLVKPLRIERVRVALQRGVDWHRASVEARRSRELLQNELSSRREQLADALGDLDIVSPQALDAILAMLTVRNRADYEHAHRVARLSISMALALGVVEPDLADIEHAALLHDIGKIAIPESLLHKPGALNPEEREVVRQSPEIGYDILKNVPFLACAAGIILASREWYSGYGYPRGLREDQIPLGSRIIAVADAYDTMTHPRIHCDAVSPGDGIRELMHCRGKQFDPQVVDTLVKLVVVR